MTTDEKGSDELLAELADPGTVDYDVHLDAARTTLEDETLADTPPATDEPGQDHPDPDETPAGDAPEYDPVPPASA